MERFFTPVCLLGLLSACTAQLPNTLPTHPEIGSSSNRAQLPRGTAEGHHPAELRYGRYTLVSTEPTTEQRDLLAQIIDVNIPSSLNPSVHDALQYVLQRSGYSLCPVTASVRVLFTRPLPAAHYRLGPIPLRNALQVLAGPTWQLTTDEVSRSVCFEQQKTDAGVALITPVLPHQSEARP
ncbi:PilL N-terminal domain-containing protein [Pseudomonas syringae]|uniref:PFGI-1 class ICE element type IV pilus protein PilL2 n=1 Tax=Pseudomonas syringae TaxID=317 RepID=UPI0006B9E114|nr:PilL N-terminal domain-containing protein [Pseudomonas syringae]KPB13089.1 Pili assembly chaperone [Pseudomonas syringae pv. syringae]MCF5030126.1 pili assembly chaperone [Pseudomonas syringae]POD19799.1 pili assembly chaperone [Pseudomonas syringae pv. syringae]UQB21739.1 PilL N-terminal domain-containing protein [Pseudomonas syringae pv. syringae]WHN05919.1 PilL N-terminal domain-containing protein [Pseudomonas syringae pv. syringae]